MMRHLAQNMIEEILATINRELFFLKILKNNKKDEITFGGFIFLYYVCNRKIIKHQKI